MPRRYGSPPALGPAGLRSSAHAASATTPTQPERLDPRAASAPARSDLSGPTREHAPRL